MPAEGGRSGSPRGPGRQPLFRGVSQELALAQGDGDAVGLWHCRAPAMNGEGLWGLGDMTVGRADKLRWRQHIYCIAITMSLVATRLSLDVVHPKVDGDIYDDDESFMMSMHHV